MTPLQRKLLEYNQGWFMVGGLVLFLLGFALDFNLIGPRRIVYGEYIMVLGALLLGYGTGRCDESCRS